MLMLAGYVVTSHQARKISADTSRGVQMWELSNVNDLGMMMGMTRLKLDKLGHELLEDLVDCSQKTIVAILPKSEWTKWAEFVVAVAGLIKNDLTDEDWQWGLDLIRQFRVQEGIVTDMNQIAWIMILLGLGYREGEALVNKPSSVGDGETSPDTPLSDARGTLLSWLTFLEEAIDDVKEKDLRSYRKYSVAHAIRNLIQAAEGDSDTWMDMIVDKFWRIVVSGSIHDKKSILVAVSSSEIEDIATEIWRLRYMDDSDSLDKNATKTKERRNKRSMGESSCVRK